MVASVSWNRGIKRTRNCSLRRLVPGTFASSGGTAVAGLLAVAFACAGCGGLNTAVVVPPATAADRPVAISKHPLDSIGKVNGRGWHLPWYRRDPMHPNGPPIPVLIAEAQTGEMTRRNGNPEIVMRNVQARLYQKGIYAADVHAAKIRANQQDSKVYASGGCRVNSILNPADTVLTADRITWETQNTRFVAEGNARVERRPRNGDVPITQEGGKIVYDLEHNTVSVL